MESRAVRCGGRPLAIAALFVYAGGPAAALGLFKESLFAGPLFAPLIAKAGADAVFGTMAAVTCVLSGANFAVDIPVITRNTNYLMGNIISGRFFERSKSAPIAPHASISYKRPVARPVYETSMTPHDRNRVPYEHPAEQWAQQVRRQEAAESLAHKF